MLLHHMVGLSSEGVDIEDFIMLSQNITVNVKKVTKSKNNLETCSYSNKK